MDIQPAVASEDEGHHCDLVPASIPTCNPAPAASSDNEGQHSDTVSQVDSVCARQRYDTSVAEGRGCAGGGIWRGENM